MLVLYMSFAHTFRRSNGAFNRVLQCTKRSSRAGEARQPQVSYGLVNVVVCLLAEHDMRAYVVVAKDRSHSCHSSYQKVGR